jgi:2-dehydropantoate 2-reductase
MKIAVVGCGALGSFYGAKLSRAGQEVHFLLRSDFSWVSQNGINIRSSDGDFHAQPECAKESAKIGVADLVLVGLKTTANDQFQPLIAPLAGPSTLILTLQNGLGNEERLACLFGSENILGGLCFVCLNRLEPGLIEHIAHGNVVLGEYQRPSESRTHHLASLFQQAGVACKVTDNLDQAHWEKLVWNVPFNGLGVASTAGYDAVLTGELPDGPCFGPGLTTNQLLADRRWESLVRELMLEVIAISNALSLTLSETTADRLIANTRKMGAYKASTLIDYERGQPLEVESIFLAPLRAAQKTGVRAPRLAALCEVLKQLDRRSLLNFAG